MAKFRRSLKFFWALCHVIHFIIFKSSFSKKPVRPKKEVDKVEESAKL
jgi:hypothetical protein